MGGKTGLFSVLYSFSPRFPLCPTFASPSLRPLSPPTPGPSPSLPRGQSSGIFVLQPRSDSSSPGRKLRAAGRVPSAVI